MKIFAIFYVSMVTILNAMLVIFIHKKINLLIRFNAVLDYNNSNKNVVYKNKDERNKKEFIHIF